MTHIWLWAVNAALLPAIAAAYYTLGGGVLIQIAIAIVVCLSCEYLCLRLTHKPIRPQLSDGSAVIAAILIGLSLPPLAPWHVAFAAAAFAMLLAKHAYGGLGNNPFNPAMAGYALAFVAFPAEFSAAHYHGDASFSQAWSAISGGLNNIDAISNPTPLLAARLQTDTASISWLVPIAAAMGGCALLIFRIADWRLTFSFLLGAWLCAQDNQTLMHGGLILAAFFVITDPVTAANSRGGRWLYGFTAGALAILLRQYGVHSDGIAFAILICNMLAPLADKIANKISRTLPKHQQPWK